MKELIGMHINGLYVSDDQHSLVFDTDQGLIGYSVDGDCCSESWFADIEGVKALLGSTVTASDTVSLDDYNTGDGRCRQEVDQVYGFKLLTEKGYTDIIFRNSSNGYYGGSISKESASSIDGMTPITDDWSSP